MARAAAAAAACTMAGISCAMRPHSRGCAKKAASNAARSAGDQPARVAAAGSCSGTRRPTSPEEGSR